MKTDLKKRKPLRPPRLQKGATLGVVAPASHFNSDRFKEGLALLKSLGFNIKVPEAIFNKVGLFAGDDRERADILNRAFSDETIDGIICARGGYGCMRILEYLDYDLICQNPKVFIGFSDVSALHWALFQRCDLVTFHGPTVTTLAGATSPTQEALQTVLTSEQPLEVIPQAGETLKPGTASGRVVGGNLTTLCHLLGTPFAPRFTGHLLIIEDRGEPLYRIDRILTQMKLAGAFNGLAGLMLGRFQDCGPASDLYNLIRDMFGDFDIPILAGFDVGHCEPNLTIPLGLEGRLDADQKRLDFDAPAVFE